MALTEIYVDPSIAANSGAGSVGAPYGDVEWAVKQANLPAGGARVNIKAGTDEILVAALQTALADTTEAGKSAAWVPSETAPLVFQGYTATAGDGGIGGISGGGSVGIMTDAVLDYVNFIDLHLHNCGAADIIKLDNYCSVIRCEADNTTGNGIWLDTTAAFISECYVHNVGGVGILSQSGEVSFNVLQNGTNTFTNALFLGVGAAARNNIISVSEASNGIIANSESVFIEGNSIFSNGGTGSGITTANNVVVAKLTNNIVEGFSGAGGIGFDIDGASIRSYGGNSAYDNTTEFNSVLDFVLDSLGGNETLASSAFTDPLNMDFSPVNIGSVKEGHLPTSFHAV